VWREGLIKIYRRENSYIKQCNMTASWLLVALDDIISNTVCYVVNDDVWDRMGVFFEDLGVCSTHWRYI
jgi:hypothetical protein